MSPRSILSARGLEKSYGGAGHDVLALRGVSFEIKAGELVALMGPSGCGKTTLLHLLGAMDRPSCGEIVLDGTRIDVLDERELARLRRREIGFVFQFFNLLPALRLVENVALPLVLDGMKRGDASERASELVSRVGLADRASHYPAELSGGEMQRAAVARALVARPKLVLADEPTGSLDTANGKRVLELVRELNRELGATFLIATHSDEVADYTRRRICMRDGRIEADEILGA